MPNWGYLLTHALYHLGLAVWIGGGLVLGALVAPRLFRELPRSQAGAVFGSILRMFARVRLFALIAVILAAGLQSLLWEGRPTLWIGLRWAAIGVMSAGLLYEIAFLEKAIGQHAARIAGMPDDDPRRAEFTRLHRRAETLMKVALAAAAAALLLS